MEEGTAVLNRSREENEFKLRDQSKRAELGELLQYMETSPMYVWYLYRRTKRMYVLCTHSLTYRHDSREREHALPIVSQSPKDR